MNFYLNDCANKPNDVIKFMDNSDSKVVFLQPYEIQYFETIEQNKESLDFWNRLYNSIPNLKINSFDNISFNELSENFEKYKSNIFNKNSYTLIKLIKMIPFLNAFQKLNIEIIDLNTTVSLDLFQPLKLNDNNDVDIKMHSSSLNFIFKNEFGYDTLTVNGCFEEIKKGSFIKMSKTLAIGSLNALGIKIDYLFFLNLKIYFIFFSMINTVRKKII